MKFCPECGSQLPTGTAKYYSAYYVGAIPIPIPNDGDLTAIRRPHAGSNNADSCSRHQTSDNSKKCSKNDTPMILPFP